MKNITALLLSIFLMTSCGGSKKVTTSDPYFNFTQEIRNRIESNNIGLNKIQFYNDKVLILERTLGSESANVSAGKVTFENGVYIHRIIIPQHTPGVFIRNINERQIDISFEVGNDLTFDCGEDLTGNYRLAGRNWKNGTAETTYDNRTYIMKGGYGYDAGDVTLQLKKNELTDVEAKSRTVTGRRVN